MGRITQSSPGVDAAAAAVFTDSVVWDNHTCAAIRPGNADSLAQLARHNAAGVDVVCLNVGFDAAPAGDTIVLLAEFRQWLRANSNQYVLVEKAADVELARASGRLG